MRIRRPLLTLGALLLTAACAATATPTEIERLRDDLSMRFLEPEPHVALAKHYYDAGQRLTAFYLLEYARQTKFTRLEFDAAYAKLFRGVPAIDASPQAEARLVKQLAAEPRSAKILRAIADIYVARGDWRRAANCLGRLVENAPDDFAAAAAMAEVLRRAEKPKESDDVLRRFAEKHPQSPEAYGQRIAKAQGAPAAKAAALEALARYPNDGVLQSALAVVLERQQKNDAAKAAYLKAARLAPDSAKVQVQTGRFLWSVLREDSEALEYYLKGYFLDPQYFDGEAVDYRVGQLAAAAARGRFKSLTDQGVSLGEILEQPNPAVVHAALGAMGRTWSAAYLPAVRKALGHDDPTVRWDALELLASHAEDVDRELDALVRDPDVRKRGLAAYLLVERRKEKSFPLMRKYLADRSQLLRFDGFSALYMSGGDAGKKIAREFIASQQLPWFKGVAAALKD